MDLSGSSLSPGHPDGLPEDQNVPDWFPGSLLFLDSNNNIPQCLFSDRQQDQVCAWALSPLPAPPTCSATDSLIIVVHEVAHWLR